jgi:UDP-N-acetylglucosamine 2-epimerase (non-hydrolysing)
MKILTIFGTRPEAIKLCPIVHELQGQASKYRADGAKVCSTVCVTAQHRDMLDQVLTVFGVRPDFDLNLMTANQTLAQIGSGLFKGLEKILRAEKPEWVIVQGDTTSAAIAAIAAYYAGVQVAHVEAGLRTGDKWHPFPEEINRRLVGVTADLHLAPTAACCENLLHEGIDRSRIVISGNPVIDALFWAESQDRSERVRKLLAECCESRVLLVTAHRRENLGAPLRRICSALRTLAKQFAADVQIVYPVHPNPNVHSVVYQELDGVAGVHLTEPLDYLDLVHLMKQCYLVLTDSGGLQEEAPSLGKPVLVLREVTERPEAVAAGTVRLIGTDTQRIVSDASFLLTDISEYRRMAEAINPYGDGFASQRSVAALLGQPYEEFTPVSGTGAVCVSEVLRSRFREQPSFFEHTPST